MDLPRITVTNRTAGTFICAEVDWIIKPLWDQFHALLPEHLHTDPLDCRRPCLPDRVVFDTLPGRGLWLLRRRVNEVRLERVQLRTRVTLRRQMRTLARKAPGYA